MPFDGHPYVKTALLRSIKEQKPSEASTSQKATENPKKGPSPFKKLVRKMHESQGKTGIFMDRDDPEFLHASTFALCEDF